MRDNILTTTTRIDILPDVDPVGQVKEAANDSYTVETKPDHQALGGPDFQSLLQNIYDGTVITDIFGNIVEINQRTCSFLMCTPSDIIGSNIVSLLYASDLSLIKSIRNGLKDNKFILIQAACVRNDGTMFPAEISVNKLTLDDTVYFCFFIRNISVRRAAEDHLRTGNAAIQNAATGIAVVDLEGSTTYTNAALVKLLGMYDESHMLGRNIREFICDDITADSIEKAILDGLIWQGDLTIKTANGDTLYVQTSVAPNLDSDGNIIGMVLSLLDITNMKIATTQLEVTMLELQRSNKDLEQFAYAVSHDLQAPLRRISMFADIIKSKADSDLPAEITDILDRMQNSAGRMSDLIRGLLKYSKVTTQKNCFESVDINQIIDDVLVDLEVPLLETNGRIEVAEFPQIIANPLQMRQLFQNLIGNALKFHAPGVTPVVEIDIQEIPAEHGDDSDFYAITVKDNGIGFNTKDTERIFGVFQKLHKPSEYAGTGIGLAICRKIVERHGGQLTAGINPDGGAMFTVMLPQDMGGVPCNQE
jgi:PAS domain S-box-containing protein